MTDLLDRVGPGVGDAPRPPSGRRQRVQARVVDGLALLLVLAALLAPNRLADLMPWAFVRLPIEAIVLAALVLVLPLRAGRVVAVVAGVALALLAIGKVLDMGFYEVLVRPFDPVLDWVLVNDALEFLSTSIGRAGATAAAVVAVVLAVALVALVALAVLRLARLTVTHRRTAWKAVAGLAAAWIGLAVVGVQVAPGQPLAARSAAVPAYDRGVQVVAALRDKAAFAAQSRVDAFRDTPAQDLLTGLRGKNVILAFVESYGRSAVQDPGLAAIVDPVLDAGTQQLRAAGFAARTAYLTSPTVGGGSVFAHSTLLSGLWVDNEQRYQTLLASDRFTLDGAFKRAGWRTVGVMPGVTRPWPEGAFYGFDQEYDLRDLGYHGPHFSWAPMPDQFAMAQLQRLVLAPREQGPVMAEIPLVSSHTPWAPLPRLIPWSEMGDGSVFTPMAAAGTQPADIWPDATRVRTAYAQSIAYSVSTLVSFLRTYGDDDTVLVLLGDHQPAPIVTGDGASRDVPVTIVARDPAVLRQISGWDWQDGLKPTPQAPVWRMDAFRDRFLSAFGSRPASGG
ncbi:MAG: sulfatase-like hydrolase/transferase [Kineosporiaceae bacterium]